jgi:hypothetical protein
VFLQFKVSKYVVPYLQERDRPTIEIPQEPILYLDAAKFGIRRWDVKVNRDWHENFSLVGLDL